MHTAIKPSPLSSAALNFRDLPGRTAGISLLLMLVAAYFCYSITTSFEFAYDDIPQIVRNPRVHSAGFLPQYFTNHVWSQIEGQPKNLYRPLYLAWLLANFETFGRTTTGWHLVNILLHLLASYLVYLLGRRFIPENPVAALLAASIFALHPSHVEAVAWISGGTEALLSVFFLSSFLCYLEYRRRERALWLAASVFVYAGAVLVKETAVILPLVIVCYELLIAAPAASSSGPRSWLRMTRMLVPYAAVVAAYFAVRIYVLHGLAHKISDVPTLSAMLTAPWLLFFYISQFFVPIGLSPFYDVPYAHGLDLRSLILPVVALILLAAMLWWWAKRLQSRLPLFLGAWFLLTLAPALAVFLVMSRYENVHDRYLYLPSVALSLLAGLALSKMIAASHSQRRKVIGAVVIAAMLCALAVATRMQSRFWSNDLSVFARGTAMAPQNVLAKLNLTSELIRYHRLDAAFQVAEDAVKIDRDSPLALAAAGQAAYLSGHYLLADQYYSRAIALSAPHVDEFYYLGLSRIKMGRYSEALEVLRRGNSLWPDSPGYHLAMGMAFAGLGQWPLAREQYRLELAFFPGNRGAQAALANAEKKP